MWSCNKLFYLNRQAKICHGEDEIEAAQHYTLKLYVLRSVVVFGVYEPCARTGPPFLRLAGGPYQIHALFQKITFHVRTVAYSLIELVPLNLELV